MQLKMKLIKNVLNFTFSGYSLSGSYFSNPLFGYLSIDSILFNIVQLPLFTQIIPLLK